MQFQVPQFIDTEDKIVGPLTLRQFLYISLGGFVSAISYFILNTWLFVIIAFVIMAIAVGMAFIKINGQPLIKLVRAAAQFYWKPQTYIWKSPAAAALPSTPQPHASEPKGISLEKIAAGMALHKSWENLQTGSPSPEKKTSDRQFIEKRMNERYQIYQRVAGDRQAARRVDYR